MLAALGWDGDAVAVLAAPGAERAAGGLELLVPGFDDAADPAALGALGGARRSPSASPTRCSSTRSPAA